MRVHRHEWGTASTAGIEYAGRSAVAGVDYVWQLAADGREAERLARKGGNAQARVDALEIMALSAPSLDAALALGEQAAAAHRATGNGRRLAGLWSNLTYTALSLGDDAAAQRLSAEALRAAEAVDNPLELAYAHGNAGLVALFTGEPERASDAFASELRLTSRFAFDELLSEGLIGLAAVAAAQSRDELAARLSGAADASARRHDPVIVRRLEDRFFTPARTHLGEHGWHAAYAVGYALPREEAIDVALHALKSRGARKWTAASAWSPSCPTTEA